MSETENSKSLNLKLGKLECKTSSFWIAIAFLMAFTVCFITYCICNTVTHITEQYFNNMIQYRIEQVQPISQINSLPNIKQLPKSSDLSSLNQK